MKYRHFIEIDGEDVDMSTLPDEQRKEIGRKLNHNMMLALGYKEVKTSDDETA